MNRLQLEALVYSLVDQVRLRHPVEDSHIELKREWIEPLKAARILAGHANAARGEQIVWVIGLDEKDGVVGAQREELANWLPQLTTHFDGTAPDLELDLNVTLDTGEAVVALVFDTRQPPYLVRTGKDPYTREVPWREGSRTRSATRANLLQLLVPVQTLPDVEILSGKCFAREDGQRDGQRFAAGEVHLSLYITPRTQHRIVIPFHKCRGALHIQGASTFIPPPRLVFANDAQPDRAVVRPAIVATPSEVVIDGPGIVRLDAYVREDSESGEGVAVLMETDSDIVGWFELMPIGADLSIMLKVRFKRDRSPNGNPRYPRWILVDQ
ncbi:MAG: hypothetical protein AVDCRST_MAG93-6004 [uncultured Chloroflexia bacterium]|uniref:Uncharacterized protein n=1 Tax=uncultured Chloroflexia bacterium TaxID=1672391 RepID=A0A6J4LC86_9CHLR|nr:MAG: hypothetical protein AVDCRST_MAG93-6004 [uncultured Chloroflexia bacterium]